LVSANTDQYFGRRFNFLRSGFVFNSEGMNEITTRTPMNIKTKIALTAAVVIFSPLPFIVLLMVL